jgi:hypothetical protein
VDIDQHLSLAENKIFKDYHEARLRRKRLEIEEGLYLEGHDAFKLADMTAEELNEELSAHQELREYADALKKRQENFQMVDVAEIIVENKVLINRIDEVLN